MTQIQNNSERFLIAYSTIEKYLQRLTKSDRTVRFSTLVELAAQTNAAVASLRIDLQEFADLRNAIVHERTDGHVLAEPNDITCDKIVQMVGLITRPPTLRDHMTREVKIFQAGQSISEAVDTMYRRNFSQAPVYDEQTYIGLLSTNTIARWLGANVSEDIFSLGETTIQRVLEYTEDLDQVKFLSPSLSIFDALAVFQKYQARGKRLEAILVTNSGKPSEKLLGMVTVWDLPNLYQAINIKGI